MINSPGQIQDAEGRSEPRRHDRSRRCSGENLVYCSEGSPEGFNPQLFTSGTTYDASSVPIYNRLVEFKTGTTELVPDWLKSGTSVLTVKPIPSIYATA